jgi:hypothetical protein
MTWVYLRATQDSVYTAYTVRKLLMSWLTENDPEIALKAAPGDDRTDIPSDCER